MRKKRDAFFAFCLIMLFMVPSALAQWYYQSEEIEADVHIEGGARIELESSKGRVDSATVNLTLYPKQGEFLDVYDLEVIPNARKEGDSFLYTFDRPQKEVRYEISMRTKVRSASLPIASKIPFPISDLPKEIRPFLKPGEVIDSDDREIRRLASSLVEGEDDLYLAVYHIAKWTRENVNYNLSSVTADVSQKASWVLAERKGVCDEITSLFIALLRSVGVPARFVTGYAYTNSPLFPEEWGAHGWAEVYFPGYGWVPFDITYGQFGFVDATHIKMGESHDAGDSSTKYEWVGRDANLILDDLKTTVTVRSYRGKIKPEILLSLKPLKKEIGFDSYNAIEVKVKNLAHSYQMSEISLSAPSEVMIMGKKSKDVFLLPDEERTLYWIVRLEGDFEDNFLYTFPLSAVGSRNISSDSEFKSSERFESYSLDEIGSAIDLFEEEREKSYSSQVDLLCSSTKERVYSYEKETIACSIKNSGNVYLSALNVCYLNSCSILDLGISEQAEINFTINTSIVGKKDHQIIAKNGKVSKSTYLPIEILDLPEIEIGSIEVPSSAQFEQKIVSRIPLSSASYSLPQNVTITASVFGSERSWIATELVGNLSIEFEFAGSDLREGENTLRVVAQYSDLNGKRYESEGEAIIMLEEVTLTQKGALYWKAAEKKLEKMERKNIFIVFGGGIGVFIILLFALGKLLGKKESLSEEEKEKEGNG